MTKRPELTDEDLAVLEEMRASREARRAQPTKSRPISDELLRKWQEPFLAGATEVADIAPAPSRIAVIGMSSRADEIIDSLRPVRARAAATLAELGADEIGLLRADRLDPQLATLPAPARAAICARIVIADPDRSTVLVLLEQRGLLGAIDLDGWETAAPRMYVPKALVAGSGETIGTPSARYALWTSPRLATRAELLGAIVDRWHAQRQELTFRRDGVVATVKPGLGGLKPIVASPRALLELVGQRASVEGWIARPNESLDEAAHRHFKLAVTTRGRCLLAGAERTFVELFDRAHWRVTRLVRVELDDHAIHVAFTCDSTEAEAGVLAHPALAPIAASLRFAKEAPCT